MEQEFPFKPEELKFIIEYFEIIFNFEKLQHVKDK